MIAELDKNKNGKVEFDEFLEVRQLKLNTKRCRFIFNHLLQSENSSRLENSVQPYFVNALS